VNATVWLLLAVFLAVAALDWAAVHTRTPALEYLAKPGCMVVLIGAAAALDPAGRAARTALVAALALSALGDVFLMLPSERSSLFLGGLGSFFAAHVAYVIGFGLEGLEAPGLLLGLPVAGALVLGVGRPVVRAVRGGDEPELAGPVTAYVGVISLMLLTAVGTGDSRAAAGAVLFAGSDSLIARQRFIRPQPWHPLVIITTYHVAQGLLLTSFA
jgi:uncharacterized membrane protein YhhN